jgi:hypothetical protein
MTLHTEALGLGIPEDGHTAYRLGLARARIDARTEAFAAIRGAAAVAREHDRRAAFYAQQVLRNATPEGLACDDRLVDVESVAASIWDHVTSARAVRSAIRAAIGSEKT